MNSQGSSPPKGGIWEGLAKILHLPHSIAPRPTPSPATLASTPLVRPVSPAVSSVRENSVPVKKNVQSGIDYTSSLSTPSKLGEIPIVTDYDRILELVKRRQSMKLDEIARLLTLKEEQVAQELQTLEDNGLVEVKYPAFGEPLILYKKPEA